MQNLYDILRVKYDAKQDEIKKAFREFSFKFHPDTGEQPDSDAFNKVAEAFKILGNPKKRAEYDSQLAKNPIESLQETVSEVAEEYFSKL